MGRIPEAGVDDWSSGVTDEELSEIEARNDAHDVPLLAAEVRRLRAVAEVALKFLETRRRFGEAEIEKGRRYEEMKAAESLFEAAIAPEPQGGHDE